MGHYDLPDPRCRHASTGFVSYPPVGSPEFRAGTGPMASTRVCDRPACIADALEWVRASTHHEGTHTTDAQHDAARAGS